MDTSTGMGVDSTGMGLDSTGMGLDSTGMGLDSTGMWLDSTGMGLTCPPPCCSQGHHAQHSSSTSLEPGSLAYPVALRGGEEREGREGGGGGGGGGVKTTKATALARHACNCRGCSVQASHGGRREAVPDRVWLSLMMIENPKSETFTLMCLSNRMFSG